jgi:VanZ family protein
MTRRPPPLRFFTLFMAYWLPVLVYVTLILALSSRQNLQPPIQFFLSDKVLHAIEYLILGVLLARAVRASLRIGRPIVTALLALSCGIVVGTADELYQSYIPGRESSAFDLLADTTGLAIAQLLVLALRRG